MTKSLREQIEELRAATDVDNIDDSLDAGEEARDWLFENAELIGALEDFVAGKLVIGATLLINNGPVREPEQHEWFRMPNGEILQAQDAGGGYNAFQIVTRIDGKGEPPLDEYEVF